MVMTCHVSSVTMVTGQVSHGYHTCHVSSVTMVTELSYCDHTHHLVLPWLLVHCLMVISVTMVTVVLMKTDGQTLDI